MIELISAVLLCGACQAIAAPVEFDTDRAHVIVVRPLDVWSGDRSALESSMESLTHHRTSYDITLDGKRYRGSPNVFQGVSDNPVTEGVETALEGTDTRLVSNDRYWFHVRFSATLPATGYSAFARAQSEFYQRHVMRAGDPRSLSGRTSVRKFIGGALSIGSLLIPAHVLGVGDGAQVMLNSGIPDAIENLPGPERAALTPVELPDLDLSAYTVLDVWRVDFKPDIQGEILIAYRGDKTADAERDALVRAIVTLTGADTTPAAVEQSRHADFEKRVAIWDACVTSGKCQKEASNDSAE
ncbi:MULTISPECIES: hypothetical protein [Paraburkholderia]|uniref:Uncharacterized protein n=1 Tax=Paraburkholderia madseniana TaxID=2599607 RepID=A0AAP5BJP7_9BURK|nr:MULTISPECIES: hypothetical protein [Paraburkholderia]MCX4151019.1 hypothetical protein [Paraburkholderia madseniana]MDN7153951.1 hypothetical protein [Paraburkholderia sp. WS6]MDQ6412833.1 hypothetical protein [Paraburkholderia madseniana]